MQVFYVVVTPAAAASLSPHDIIQEDLDLHHLTQISAGRCKKTLQHHHHPLQQQQLYLTSSYGDL